MKVALFTREYPPDVYGGAGVHVEYLARELRAFEDVTVHAWGTGDVPHAAWDALRLNVTVTDFDAGERDFASLAWRPSRFGEQAIPGSGTFSRR